MSINKLTKAYLFAESSNLCSNNLCAALEGYKEQNETMKLIRQEESSNSLMKRMMIRNDLEKAKDKIKRYPFLSNCVALDIYKKEHSIVDVHEINVKEFKKWYNTSFSCHKYLCKNI